MKMKQGSGGGSTFEPISENLHDAVCIAVIGIGTQTFTWKNEEKSSDKVMITWEIPKERRTWENKEGEKFEGPSTISKEYTNSTDDRSHLQNDLKGWRGRAFTADELVTFDIKDLLGKNCRLMVTHSSGKGANSDKTYANVSTVTPYKGEAFDAESELVYYDSEEHTEASYAKLKQWIQKKVVLPDGSCPFVEGGATGDVANSTNTPAIVEEEEDAPVPF